MIERAHRKALKIVSAKAEQSLQNKDYRQAGIAANQAAALHELEQARIEIFNKYNIPDIEQPAIEPMSIEECITEVLGDDIKIIDEHSISHEQASALFHLVRRQVDRMDFDISIASIEKTLGISAHQIRYLMKKFEEYNIGIAVETERNVHIDKNGIAALALAKALVPMTAAQDKAGVIINTMLPALPAEMIIDEEHE